MAETDTNTTDVSITWTASEFIAHEKSNSWYLKLGGVAVVVALILFLLTRDKIASGFILFAALLLGVYAAREPRELEYQITVHGVSVGEKYHDFQEFRSFTIVPEGAFSSIMFIPLKRFAPAVSIYYSPEEEDRIVDVLEERLPYDDTRSDPIDNFMRHIRF
ncbi:MAG: hypothetical protein JWO41_133 [Candidatus Saccharibacteria bacterium]|nr:hypothetical protein [Candidatus Saccharibacteria bacterium]